MLSPVACLPFEDQESDPEVEFRLVLFAPLDEERLEGVK